MKTFFLNINIWYLIIVAIFVILLVIIFRLVIIKRIPKDKVNIVQKPELRDNFVLTRDCYKLKTYQQINKKSKIIVVCVHNLQGQKEDFKLFSSLCHQDYSLIAYDRRGVGQNRDQWKFHSFSTDINDLQDVIVAVKTRYPNHKIILFGEAIGAAIACYACKNNNIDALIISN